MRLFLAPMEGVVDWVTRELLTRNGHFDYCATEFIRVTDQLLPPRVFFRDCPELKQGGKTQSGTPVFVQLLGSRPEAMAENALRAIALGAPGIDLNFGCPAKTVNRHDGGAALLKTPKRVYEVVRAVRDAVPNQIPVSAKIRLGFDSPDRALEIARFVEQAGASWLIVHARTRMEGYRPPAHWDWVRKINEAIAIPVVANGDVWSFEDYQRCVAVSGCKDVMLGRGVMARPDLATQIKSDGKQAYWSWPSCLESLEEFFHLSAEFRTPHHAVCRFKQWVRLLGRFEPQALAFFEQIKRSRTAEEILSFIYNARGLDYSQANPETKEFPCLPLKQATF